MGGARSLSETPFLLFFQVLPGVSSYTGARSTYWGELNELFL